MSLEAPSFQAPGLWASVWKLLRLRLVIFFSGFRRANARRKFGTVVLGVFIVGLVGLIFFLSRSLLHFLQSPELAQFSGQMRPLLENIPALIFTGAFIGLLLTSFGVLLQALYLAGDMDFLLATPVPLRAVFVAKLLQAILPNFSLICFFALPLLWGLGAAWGYNLLYFPLVVVILAALALSAAGLSSLLVMVVVRVFPARRVAEVLGFVGAVSSFICSQSGQLARFNRVDPMQAERAFQSIGNLSPVWSPLTWVGRGLVDLGTGRWLPAVGQLTASLGLMALIFGASLLTAERLYYSGWASMQGTHQKKKKAPAARAENGSPRFSLLGLLPPVVRSIMVKDYRILRRDLRNMSQLVTPLIFGLVYAVMLTRDDPSGGELPPDNPFFEQLFQNMPLYLNVALALFVSWMLLGRLAGMAFSQEGKNYWILKTAPVSAGQLLLSKYLVAFLPTLGLGWLFLGLMFLFQRGDPSALLYTALVVALCIAGNAGLNLAFGVVGTNLKWEDPRHMSRGTTGCLGALASMAFLPLALILFFGPPLLAAVLGSAPWLGQSLGLLLGAAFCLAAGLGPLLLVRGRVVNLGEDE